MVEGLECGVKMPENVEQQLYSAVPSGTAEDQNTEQCSTDASQCFADEAEDYEKVIGARNQGLIFASTLTARRKRIDFGLTLQIPYGDICFHRCGI